jgi:hypothetical protein
LTPTRTRVRHDFDAYIARPNMSLSRCVIPPAMTHSNGARPTRRPVPAPHTQTSSAFAAPARPTGT